MILKKRVTYSPKYNYKIKSKSQLLNIWAIFKNLNIKAWQFFYMVKNLNLLLMWALYTNSRYNIEMYLLVLDNSIVQLFTA